MIGLLTPYEVLNYGTKLQAYAVQEIISEYDNTEIIQFRPNFPERVKRKLERKRMGDKYNDSKNTVNQGIISSELIDKRKRAIHSFRTKLNITPQVYGFSALRKKAASYQAVVCGSDQIWNPVNLPEHIFMLEFVPGNVRRIAFAPSFGVSSIPAQLEATYRKRLKSIEYFSVREQSGCEILAKLGIQDVFCSLDPTLVLDEKCWNSLADEGKGIPTEPYIFCYFLGSHDLGRQLARKVSDKLGLKIVNLPHFKSYVEADIGFADYDLYEVSPQDFIALIRNASYVCTDSFHGTAFSMIFEKEFICCERHKIADTGATNDRLYSILHILNLSEHLIRNMGELEALLSQNIDYKVVKNRLNKKRRETREFLSKSIRSFEND